MKKRVVFGLGLAVFIVGVIQVVKHLGVEIPGSAHAQQQIDWQWGTCVNAGATCTNCVEPNDCDLKVTVVTVFCDEVGGATGCETGPERVKGTCEGFFGSCPFRPQLCGVTMNPFCPEVLDSFGSVVGCGGPMCVISPFAGPCDGC